MLASDLADAVRTAESSTPFSPAVDESKLDIDFVRGGAVAAAPAAFITASLVASNQTFEHDATHKSIDVSGIAADILVTVNKSTTNKNTVNVQRLDGTGGVATYAIANDGGSINNVVAGRANQQVRIVLNSEIEILEVTDVSGVQVALGRKATSSSLLTGNSIVEVVQSNAGGLETLEVGRSADSANVELIVGADMHVGTLVKGSGFNGKLVLNYPDAASKTALVKAVDLSTATPYIQGFGRLTGFDATSVQEVKAGKGRQELVAGDQAVTFSGGDKDDVLLGSANAQVFDGEGGNDFIRTGDGDDTARGGDGNDQIAAGTGSDVLEGGAGNDTYYFGEANDDSENAWGTNDTITDTVGDNTLDFSAIAANLNVSINGDSVEVTATEEIDNELPDGLSYGSDSDAVELALGNNSIPTVQNFGEVSETVAGGALIARMIVGTGRDQVSVTAPTIQEVRDELGEEATSTITANVTVHASPLGARITAGDNAIAYLDSGGFWQQTNELLLNRLLPDAVEASTDVWNVPETTITLAVGEFRNRTVAEYEAEQFEVTLFSEPEWTGFAGTYSDLKAALKSYYRNDLEELIEVASSVDSISADQDRLNEIAEELWLTSIAEQIATKFSVTGEVNAEIVHRDGEDFLSVSIEDHSGDIAIAPNTVSLPATLADSFSETQRLSGTAAVSRFVAPADNDAQVAYDIDALTRDLSIAFDGDQAKSTLDVSDIAAEMRITFVDAGEVEIEVLDGGTTPTIAAQGISELIVGNGVKTFVLTEDGGAGQVTVTDSSSDASERRIVLGTGFLDQTVVLNNHTTDAFVIGSDSYAAHSLEFEGGSLAAPDFGDMTFASVTAEGGFQGAVHVKAVELVDSGRGNDLVELTVATPTNQTISTNDGDDEIIGSDLIDIIEAGDGGDKLRGNDGNDDLRGGEGDDELIGGAGDDLLTGGKDSDTYKYEATGWGVDEIVEKKGEGDLDSIDFQDVNTTMTHVITGNDYHAFTGTDHVAAAQTQLTGEERSLGEIRVGTTDSWIPFDPTNASHVDSAADRISTTNEQFQFIERIVTSQGDNAFYFGNDWGPSSALRSIVGAIGGSVGNGIASILAPNSDRLLEVDTSAASNLVLDFRQVTDELRFEFETEEDGSTSLTVIKVTGFDVPLLDVDIIDSAEMEHNKIKFTNVDENTTIYAGREKNTFVPIGQTEFAGELVGGEGYRDWVAQLIASGGSNSGSALERLAVIVDQLSNVNSLLGGKLPDIFVTNVIDASESTIASVSGDSVWETAVNAANNLVFDASLVDTGTPVTIEETSTSPQIFEIRSLLSSGNFNIEHEGSETGDIDFDADAATVQSELETLLSRNDFAVTSSAIQGQRSWTITFDPAAPPTTTPIVGTSQVETQSASGFTGSISHINSVIFSTGVNRITGSDGSIDPTTSIQDLGAGDASDLSFQDFVQALFGNGTRPGDDTFEVSGNLLRQAKDILATNLGASPEESPTLNKLADVALKSWFGSTIAPGVHALSGLNGSDTYKFEGIFGAAVVLEPNSERAAERNYSDTLDLSGLDYDVTIDVYHAALQDVPGYSDILNALGNVVTDLPPVDEVSEIWVVRDNSISEQASALTLGVADPEDIFGGDAGNVILAFDVENLALGDQQSTIKFHGDATIHGIVSAGEDATVILDYSEDSLDPDGDVASGSAFDLQVDGRGGVQWDLLPETVITPAFTLGALEIDAVTYPGYSIEYASASRIEGNRLLGRDAFYSLMDSWGIPNTDTIFGAIADQAGLENWSSSNAITQVDGVILPAGNVIADVDAGHADVGGTAWHASSSPGTVNLSMNAGDLRIEINADAGVWQLADATTPTTKTVPLAANITADQLQSALNLIDGGPGDYVVTGSVADDFVVSSVMTTPDFTAIVDDIPLQPGITAGLYQLRASANGGETVANVSHVGLGSGDKIIFGSGGRAESDAFTVMADERLGKSMLVSDPDSPARLHLDNGLFDAGTVNAHHFGSVSIYWVDTTQYLITLQAELTEHPDDLNASWENSTMDLSAGGEQDKLDDGLLAFAGWSTQLDDVLVNEVLTIDMPFGNVNLAQYVDPEADNNTFAPKIEALRTAVGSYSPAGTPTVDDFLAHVNGESNASDTFTVTRNCNGIHGYTAELEIASFEHLLDLDFGSWSFDDLGLGDLPFDLGLSVESLSQLEISGAITLTFDFGLDPDGEFYVSDPEIGAELSMGDDAYAVATDVDSGTGERTLAWDSSTGEIFVEGNANEWLAANDVVSIQDVDGLPVSFVVASIGTYDSGTDRTSVFVNDLEGNAGGFDDTVQSATLQKTFDVDINVGIFGLKVNDGFIDFDAGVGITIDSYLDSAALASNSLGGDIDVDLGGDFEYSVYLPVELSGALSGLNDHQAIISAFSSELPGDVGLKELIFSIPQSIRMEGFSELLQMRTISLDMILDALEMTLDDLVGIDREVYGRIVGEDLEVFTPVWMQTSTIAAGFSAILDGEGFPQSQTVSLGDAREQIVYEYDDGLGNDVWGVEVGGELEVFEERWSLLGTFESDEYLSLDAPDPDINVTLTDGASATLSELRLRTGSMYQDIPLAGVSAADVLGGGAVSFAEKLRDAISTVRNTRSGSGGSLAINLVLVILIAGLVVAGWFLANQQQMLDQAETARTSAEARLSVLEDRLRVTDEALSETGADTNVKINFWESEIRKLWAVSNERNKDWIQDNQALLKKQSAELDQVAKDLKALTGKVSAQAEAVLAAGKLSGDVETVNGRVNTLLETQRDLVDKVNKTRQTVASLQAGLANRVAENEQAVASMDAFRAQITGRLLELERRLSGG